MRQMYVVSRPGWQADYHSLDRLGGGIAIDWSQVGEQYRETPGFTVEVTAPAAAGDVAVSVEALPGDVKAGTIVDFGGDEIVRVTADAAAGAVALAVTALTAALEGGETAVIAGSGRKMIISGTAIGDTLGAGGSPRVAGANPAIGLLETNAIEGDLTAAKTGYGVVIGGVIYQNLLPAELDADTRTELQDAGTRFVFQTYSDSRAA